MRTLPTWRLLPGQRLLHRCWEGECVLYNDLSGDTHLLGECALGLLQLLQAGARTAPLLAAALGWGAASGNETAVPADGEALLDALLADLAALHLIESVPC